MGKEIMKTRPVSFEAPGRIVTSRRVCVLVRNRWVGGRAGKVVLVRIENRAGIRFGFGFKYTN